MLNSKWQTGTGKRLDPGNHVVCRARVAASLPAIAQLQARWAETWVYADAELILASQREVPSMAKLFTIRLDGTLSIKQALKLLANELDLEGQA
jgi:hypothetical protein